MSNNGAPPLPSPRSAGVRTRKQMDEEEKRDKDKFLKDYLVPSVLYKTLELRSFCNPLFLRRTLAYSKQQRRKQEDSRVDGAKRRVLLAEDVLGVKPFIDAGLCPILGKVEKRLNIGLVSFKMRNSYLGKLKAPEDELSIRARLECNNETRETLWATIPVSVGYAQCRLSYGVDLFTFASDFFEHQSSRVPHEQTQIWRAVLAIPKVSTMDIRRSHRSSNPSDMLDPSHICHTITVHVKNSGRRFVTEGSYGVPVVSGVDGTVMGTAEIFIRWKYLPAGAAVPLEHVAAPASVTSSMRAPFASLVSAGLSSTTLPAPKPAPPTTSSSSSSSSAPSSLWSSSSASSSSSSLSFSSSSSSSSALSSAPAEALLAAAPSAPSAPAPSPPAAAPAAHNAQSLATASAKNLSASLRASRPQTRRSRAPRVRFNFFYDGGALFQVEERSDLCCPWCAMEVVCVEDMLLHLNASHDLFFFFVRSSPDGVDHDIDVQLKTAASPSFVLPVIDGVKNSFRVAAEKGSAASSASASGSGSAPASASAAASEGKGAAGRKAAANGDDAHGDNSSIGDASAEGGEAQSNGRVVTNPAKGVHSFVFLAGSSRHQNGEASGKRAPGVQGKKRAVSGATVAGVDGDGRAKRARSMAGGEEVEPAEDVGENAPERRLARLSKSKFYHAGNLQRFSTPELLDDDSDHEAEESWMWAISDRLLDEFEDVTVNEKRFMKLWNNFVRRNTIFADAHFPDLCLRFAKEMGSQVVADHLRNNFLFHLIAMWEWNLVSTNCIRACMSSIDEHAHLTGAQNGSLSVALASAPASSSSGTSSSSSTGPNPGPTPAVSSAESQ